jgi:hypothetical protein
MHKHPQYVIDVHHSRYHYYVWVIVSVVMHIAIGYYFCEVGLYMPIVVIFLSSSYLLSIVMVVSRKKDRYSLIIDERGDFTYQGSAIMHGKVLTSSYGTSWYILLWFNRRIDNRVMHLMIWRDAIADADYRRLCRIIRLKRHMI